MHKTRLFCSHNIYMSSDHEMSFIKVSIYLTLIQYYNGKHFCIVKSTERYDKSNFLTFLTKPFSIFICIFIPHQLIMQIAKHKAYCRQVLCKLLFLERTYHCHENTSLISITLIAYTWPYSIMLYHINWVRLIMQQTSS